VLVDQDGPLADFDAALHEVLDDAGYDSSALIRTQWETSDDVRNHFGPEAADLVDRMRHTAGFYRRLPVVSGAQEAIEELLDRGLHVVVCTAPSLKNVTCASDKIAWIEEHFPRLRKSFAVVRDKTLVRGAVLVDDKPAVNGALQPTWEHVRFVTVSHRGIEFSDDQSSRAMHGWEQRDVIYDSLADHDKRSGGLAAEPA
jgi:5'-nucleotidase